MTEQEWLNNTGDPVDSLKEQFEELKKHNDYLNQIIAAVEQICSAQRRPTTTIPDMYFTDLVKYTTASR